MEIRLIGGNYWQVVGSNSMIVHDKFILEYISVEIGGFPSIISEYNNLITVS